MGHNKASDRAIAEEEEEEEEHYKRMMTLCVELLSFIAFCPVLYIVLVHT